MNKLIFATLISLAASGVSAQYSQRPTQHRESALAQDDARSAFALGSGYALYRRIVLGDTGVDVQPAAPAMEDSARVVPGSYALYLMYYNGLSKVEAIAQARRIGESPAAAADTSRAVRSQLTPYELYLRAVVGWSDEAIVRSRGGAPSSQADAGLVSTAAD
ncbi:hypothetical protein [Piscinibacter sp.]|jgi:hypothetical protein|uniref:hypothetical protein n=1 Tax=Piscinibacter sp. TaxID=1903157 RepID=UPI003559DC53